MKVELGPVIVRSGKSVSKVRIRSGGTVLHDVEVAGEQVVVRGVDVGVDAELDGVGVAGVPCIVLVACQVDRLVVLPRPSNWYGPLPIGSSLHASMSATQASAIG